jgi:hypothetical protein
MKLRFPHAGIHPDLFNKIQLNLGSKHMAAITCTATTYAKTSRHSRWTRERLHPKRECFACRKLSPDKDRSDSGAEYSSGLAVRLAPTRIRAWSSRELQQGQGSSDGSVRSSSSSHLVVDSIQFFVDASPSLGFCPAINCSYLLSVLFARLLASPPIRLVVASAQPTSTSLSPCTHRSATSLCPDFTTIYLDSFTLFASPSPFLFRFHLSASLT